MNEPPNFFLADNPNLKPRHEVRIESLTAQPTRDGRRIKVQLVVTPFREQPNFDIALFDAAQNQVGGTTVIAAMNFRLEFILHLRGAPADPAGEYAVLAALYYDDPSTPQDRAETTVRIPAREEPPTPSSPA